MKKIKLFIISIFLLVLSSCTTKETTYTITWQNYDGSILEVDTNVKKGSMPSYDGSIPAKQSDNQYSYSFAGWDNELSIVTENKIYKAAFSSSINKYTVTWKNYDDSILETDSNVEYGSTPTYDGTTPTRTSDQNYNYEFDGWDKEITSVTGNVSYKAVYKTSERITLPSATPVVSNNGKQVTYGLYPQSRVKDTTILNALNEITADTLGFYLYEGDYYIKETATLYNNESYKFDDGDDIVNGTSYFFKCNPVVWDVIEVNNNEYTLISNVLLDTIVYYQNYDLRAVNDTTILPNNYEMSYVYSFLNNDFLTYTFRYDNLSSQDKRVSLPSVSEVKNVNLAAKTTDFARARGAWYNTRNTNLSYNGTYWTKDVSTEFNYAVSVINSAGNVSTYAVNGDCYCIRPMIKIKIEK